jgi:hypothetical protein
LPPHDRLPHPDATFGRLTASVKAMPSSGFSRRRLLREGTLAGAGLVLLGGSGSARGAVPGGSGSAAQAPVPAPELAGTPERMLSTMNLVAARMDPQWRPDRAAYNPVADDYSVAVNAAMLQVHAVAAAQGATGPARRDDRALTLATRLTASPAPFREEAIPAMRGDKMLHVPGWINSLQDPSAEQDKAIDPQVATALVVALRAADALGMHTDLRALIVDRITRAANGAFFRYPMERLNQINWNAELQAAAAAASGDSTLLREDYRRYALRFLGHLASPQRGQRVGNLGPGYHFHYLPQERAGHPYNQHSSEYANETLTFLAAHAPALAGGMAPWPEWAHDRARAWVTRTLCGDWTHTGMLNWDTGLGAQRWMVGKVWAFAQQGLMAIARSPEFHADPRYAGWARWMLERSFGLYERWSAADATGLAPPTLYGVRLHSQGDSGRLLFAARMGANAAQAISNGVSAITPVQPPPLAATDPDTGRVAFTSLRYSTALIGAGTRAFSYGGLDPVRLLDGAGAVLTTIGGRSPGNISARVEDARGRLIIDSARRRDRGRPDAVALITEKGRRRLVVRSSRSYPRTPYAGPVRAVEVAGRITHGAFSLSADHRLSATKIDLFWSAKAARRAMRLSVLVPLRDGAVATCVLDSGERIALTVGGPAGPRLSKIAQIEIEGADGSHLGIAVGQAPPRALVRAIFVPPRGAAPGVNAALEFGGGRVGRARQRLSLRLTPRPRL